MIGRETDKMIKIINENGKQKAPFVLVQRNLCISFAEAKRAVQQLIDILDIERKFEENHGN